VAPSATSNSTAASGFNSAVINGNNSAQHFSVPITAPVASVVSPPFSQVAGSDFIVVDAEGNQQMLFLTSETTAPTALGKGINL
jgi:hypothetical protein